MQLSVSGKLVFITSSLKDVMVLHELGFAAIAFSSEAIPTKGENAAFVRKVIQHLQSRFETVILFMDNDVAGKEYTEKLKRTYRIDAVLIPDGFPKDISDFHKKYGRRKTRRLLNKLIKKNYEKTIKLADL